MTKRTMTCEESLKLLAAFLDGELGAAEHGRIEQHLEICRSCFSRSEFERRLKTQLAALRTRPLEPKFEERIRALIGHVREA